MITYIAGLAAGFAILLFSGEWLVKGAVAFALRLGITPLIISLTIVAFGTSAPELFVSVEAATDGLSGISIGNVVGSNIANVLLVLGLPAIFFQSLNDHGPMHKQMIFLMAAIFLFITLCFFSPLIYWHGSLLLLLMMIFTYSTIRKCRNDKCQQSINEDDDDEEISEASKLIEKPLIIYALIIIGIIGLPLGARLIVVSAGNIAAKFGVSDQVIGLTIVAIGTSLPEVAVTFSSFRTNHFAVAIGNVIGSNIFNILLVMGITTVIAPVIVPAEFIKIDLWVMLASSLLLVPFVIGKTSLNRVWGIIFTILYCSYILIVVAGRYS